MILHTPTLGAAFILLSLVLGISLIFSWTLNRNIPALLWWGSTFCLVFLGMGMVAPRSGAPTVPTLLVANAIMALAYGVLYAGCRVFNGRSWALPACLVGPTLWIALFPAIFDAPNLRLMVMSGIAAAYSFLSAAELWKHSPYKLASRHVAVVLLAILGAFNTARGHLGLSLSSIAWIDAFADRWSAEMALLLVAYIPGLAFAFLSMAKEKVEIAYKEAALVDPLTGVPNRRAFLQNATRLIGSAGRHPVTCMLFDLDNFKSLNDSFGHDLGDEVLCLFAQFLSRSLPEGSYGRLGGEEFGAILAMNSEAAEELAQAIRKDFAAASQTIRGRPVMTTVSVGCATAVGATPKALIQQADAELYNAKASGRNTVSARWLDRTSPNGPVD